MDTSAKLRVNLVSKEFEIEGSEEFVKSYSDKISILFELLQSQPQEKAKPPKPLSDKESSKGTVSDTNHTKEIPPTFGEYIHGFPKTIKDTDKILIAGNFVQSQNAEENSFMTKDANKTLVDHGIKLSNASTFLKANISTKRIIKLPQGKFRVSVEGIDHLLSLLKNED